MIESAIIQALFKLVLALMAIGLARGSLLWFDRATGVNFFETLKEATPNARLAYFGARFVGVCLLFGFVIS